MTEINWKALNDVTITQFKDLIKSRLKEAIDNVVDCKEDRTFHNTLQPVIDADHLNNILDFVCCEVSMFHPDESVREASIKSKKELQEFEVECNMRTDFYHAVKEYNAKMGASNARDLSAEQTKYLQDLMRKFKRTGLELSNDKQIELKEIINKINDLSNQFENNLSDYSETLLFTKEELSGMPLYWFEAAEQKEEKYVVPMKMPDTLLVLENVDSEQVRQLLLTKYHSKCQEVNVPLISQIAMLRDKQAKLLGYKNYVDFKVEINLAKTGSNVFDFLYDLNQKFDDLYDQCMKNVKQLKAKCMNDANAIIMPWDINYYFRLDTEQRINLNYKEIEEYFPEEHVTKTILEIYETLLSLKFIKVDTDNVWHDDVGYYRVYDKNENGQLIGHFYLDLYPRDKKYSHFCCLPCATRCKLADGTIQLPCAILLCNFSKTCPLESLVTYFHEFGHVIHHLLSNNSLADLSAFAVETDFIEAMSQMLELWCNEPEILKRLSCHRNTKEKLSNEQIEKIIKGTRINQVPFLKRQIMFSLLDLNIHTKTQDDLNDTSEPIDALYSKVHQEIMKFAPTEDTNFCGLFGHLASEYGASYYGYLWSEVLAADMYTKFKEHGIFNQEIGNRYKEKVLVPGSLRPGNELIRDFLERDPSNQPFINKYIES